MNRSKKDIQILCTLGPASLNEKAIRRMDEAGVHIFRLNLSHIPLEDLGERIDFIRKFSDIPICIDTEGAQIRTGVVRDGRIKVQEGRRIVIVSRERTSDEETLYLKPAGIVELLKVGDLISIDYDTALLRVFEVGPQGAVAIALYDGSIASNKGISVANRRIDLPPLTEKDRKALALGKKMGVRHVALSFANRKEDVEELRALCDKDVFVISKIETHKSLHQLDGIMDASDALLIDRGDLSKEASITNIPFLQKMVIGRAKKRGIAVFVATNLLESMIASKSPTRAEVNDVVNTLSDGADGLVLAAETAIGKHPVGSVNFIKSIIHQFRKHEAEGVSLEENRSEPDYFLIAPHGGELVERNRCADENPKAADFPHAVPATEADLMDVEQIANGTYSPLTGFMTEDEFQGVLSDYRLPTGETWTLPILFQISKDRTQGMKSGDKVALTGADGAVYGVLHLRDIFRLDFEKTAAAWFHTTSPEHPGVRRLKERGEYCLGGAVDLVKRIPRPLEKYTLTPRETRIVFKHKGWTKIVGFHTRNVIHRAHEYMQMAALARQFADGLFVHPLIGPKKKDDFSADIILRSYQMMMNEHYPKGKVLFSAFTSYPRYAGPREAVFTALCRKNFGCTHFIVGRDHSGVGSFYQPMEARELFKSLKGLGIEPVFFDKVYYCDRCRSYTEGCAHGENKDFSISGSRIREIFLSGGKPEEWLMRGDISDMICESIKKNEPVFVR